MYPPKTQIVYIPTHAEGDINHPDVEYGFVTSSNDMFVFCRFWRKDSSPSAPVLRTRANREACNPRDLTEQHFTDQSFVEAAWQAYCQGYNREEK